MKNTVTQYLNRLAVQNDRLTLAQVINPIADRLSSMCLTDAGLRIKGGSASAIVQAHTAIVASANGTLVYKAADTDMAALSGTVTNAKFNVFAFYIDNGGTLTSGMGIEGATLAAVVFPPNPEKKALIGFVIVNPTGTGNFVGGTTQLDDGTVTPNAVFVNAQAGFDPSVVL